MNLDDYLLRQVSGEEFQRLSNEKPSIVSQVMGKFNEVWKPKVKDVKVTFKYNPTRKLIGIYIQRGKKEELVVENSRNGLSEEEDTVVGSLYCALERRLDRLRLPREEWIPSSR